jgi:putative IMPACT (imprinted ancient) family translation regulator
MPDHPQIPAATARTELRFVNSRFIGSAGPAASVDEAKAFVAAVRAEMPDATHHVYAYVIGHGASKTEGMSIQANRASRSREQTEAPAEPPEASKG